MTLNLNTAGGWIIWGLTVCLRCVFTPLSTHTRHTQPVYAIFSSINTVFWHQVPYFIPLCQMPCFVSKRFKQSNPVQVATTFEHNSIFDRDVTLLLPYLLFHNWPTNFSSGYYNCPGWHSFWMQLLVSIEKRFWVGGMWAFDMKY